MPRKKKEKVEETEKPPPKKRGRKPKKKDPNEAPKIPKKRGRKPKGGEIIKKDTLNKLPDKNIQHNIILHLYITKFFFLTINFTFLRVNNIYLLFK